MASLLRQIVAGPRLRHEEAELDLCYVHTHPTIIATSGPSATYPQIAYRNPLSSLVKFLDKKHGDNWAIWEFRAEGTGYGDDEVYGRINHYPWPDHHPPPFGLVPLIVGGMRNWLRDEQGQERAGRAVVVHCKAGKGRSGTAACSYLIAEEGWSGDEAMRRFTERRMRPGFGNGLSIPSQRRTVGYVERWARVGGKRYVERKCEVVEVHIWGLRDGVKVAVEGFVDEGKVIKNFHTFGRSEREIVRGNIAKGHVFANAATEAMKKKNGGGADTSTTSTMNENSQPSALDRTGSELLQEGGDVIFRPARPITLETNDINIDIERRNKSKYSAFAMVSAVAHVWFNTYFEGHGPEQNGLADTSGVFEIEWDAMDGIKGSSRKGTRAFDRIAVVWRAVEEGIAVPEPGFGEPIRQMRSAVVGPNDVPADERSQDFEKKLGLREPDTASAAISRASSLGEGREGKEDDVKSEIEGVRAHYGEDESSSPGREADGGIVHVNPATEAVDAVHGKASSQMDGRGHV
ncbi:hypothetical protein LTR62_006832 [Meristemomyces frigidus]|uniref:phosphatidylinositol-3,4,5-trisphosphate 3-phosphatase n=1 Tax=Meristemomyces frigidus TaxID=1508187 RepID=A0AAN7YPH9_9PEZI|nr:hypothetical protein LTR62_006832 [Meristemomyces frigidus]